MDYKTYRVTIHVTIDVEVPPGVDDRAEWAAEEAAEWMDEHAPDMDYVIDDEVVDITPDDSTYYDDQKYDLWKEEQPDPREYDV